MIIATKIQPIDRELVLKLLGTAADRSAMLANFAREKLAEAKQVNRQVLGTVPPYQTYVDQSLGASEDNVKPNGVIVYEFDLIIEIATWIEHQLITHSPVLTGRYQRSHRIYADGSDPVEVDSIPLSTQELVFAPTVPYARLIEPHGGRSGESKQAPDGVYQAVAALARARYAGIKISFEYRSIAGREESASEKSVRPRKPRDMRQPVIVITF